MAYTYAFDNEAYSSGSNMAVMSLNLGDKVSVLTNGAKRDLNGPILDF